MDNGTDVAQAWKGFDEPRRAALLKKMSPEQKANLRKALESGSASPAAPADKTPPTPPAPGPLDRFAGYVANKLPNLTPEDEHKEAQGYGTTYFGEGGDRFITNTARTAARDLAAIPAGVVDYFWKNGIKGPWTPKQSAQRMQEDAAQGQRFDPSKPVTGADVSDYASEKAGGLAAGVIAGETVGGVMGLAPRAVRRTAEAVTGTGPRVTKGLAKDTAEANAKDAAKVAEQNSVESLKAEMKRKQELSAHAAETAKAEGKNQGVTEDLQSKLADQRRIAPTEQKLRTAWGNLRAGIETARNNALKIGNEKYSAVNEALSPIPADMETLWTAYSDALGSFGESQSVPPLLARMEKAMKEPLTYKDEQSLYSDLGKELSKGTLPGTTFHAYDVLHEAVGEDMQRIADSQGKGAELTAARNYWRRMKQTFGKPLTLRDAASKTLGKSASGLSAEDALQNQIRLLGSFDPAIPKQFNHVQNIEKGVDALPSPVPERVLTRDAAEKRVTPPKLSLTPKPPAKLPAPRTIGAEDVQAAKAESMGKRAEHAQNRGLGAVASGFALFDAIRSAMTGNWKEVGMDVAARTGVSVAQHGFAKLLSNPKFVEYMSQATARDVAEIPPDLRGNFPALVKAAQAKGIKVSPALLGIAAVSGLPAPRQQNATDAWQGVPPQ